MAKLFDCITPELQDFIHNQQLFFVATAPMSLTGHINLSPKGLDTFQILSPTQVAYLDLTGSGNETSAHLQENGRITFMFCAFQGTPKILRLYGSGRTVLPTHSDWPNLSKYFADIPGVRQIITADIERVQTSCGFGVPYYQHQGPRDTLIQWAEKKGQDGLQAYWREKGQISIDGLPTPFGHALDSQTSEES
ncbi:MAG: pyridoxamine 5'-phosphate oxidase family protein [Leptolyngbyaceae cyanobacterium MO_188.B28]|nr:pyridoxamine 5'-phosphate oxidase family protein [Leptolyngbyaceae cyanobacterium MO_188.B28]